MNSRFTKAALDILNRYRASLFFLWTLVVFFGAVRGILFLSSGLTLFDGVGIVPELTWSSVFSGFLFFVGSAFLLSVVFLHIRYLGVLVTSQAAADDE